REGFGARQDRRLAEDDAITSGTRLLRKSSHQTGEDHAADTASVPLSAVPVHRGMPHGRSAAAGFYGSSRGRRSVALHRAGDRQNRGHAAGRWLERESSFRRFKGENGT